MTSHRDDPIRVLHVDDELEFAELAARYVEDHTEAITVEVVSTGEEVLDRIDSGAVHCVVSDFNMPSMDGIELLEAVRERDEDLPFILFTGKGSEEIASRAISAGVTDYLQKETSSGQYEVLANRIENVVSQYRAERRAAKQERVLGILQEVNRSLVQADTADEIHEAVTDILARAEPYRVAWFGEVDDDWDRVVPVAVAGADIEEVRPVSVRDVGSEDDPLSRALDGDSIEVCDPMAPAVDVWAEAPPPSVERAVVVPVAYQGDPHGFLVLLGDPASPLDRSELEMLDEIAGDVAQGLHAAAVRSELRQHQTAVEAVPEGVFLLDEDATIDLINEPAASLVDLTPDDLLGEPFPTFIEAGIVDDSIIDWYLTSVREMLSSGTDREDATYETEIAVPEGDSRVIEIHLTLRPFVDEYRGTVGVVRDVTHRTEREVDLERKERRFDAMFNDPNVLVAMVAPDGSVEEVNETAMEYVEHGRGEIVGEVFWETPWFAGEAVDRDEIEARTRRAADGEYSTCEMHIVDAAGDPRTIGGVFRPVVDDDGVVTSIVVSGRDITARRARERELERERDRFAALFEGLPNPVVHGELMDGEPIVRSVNPAFEEVFGYDAEEAVGRNLDELTVPGGRLDEARAINERIATDDRVRTPVTRLTADGPREFVLDLVIRKSAGPHREGYAIYTDITEHRARERELERKNERLEAFASVVSHDLRNPLGVATGRLELAKDDCESPHLEGVEESLARMETLVDDLLALAREGAPLTELEPVPVRTVIEDAWGTVETADATLELAVDGSVTCDRNRLRQLFENLFRNAVEHAGPDVTVAVGHLDGGAGLYVEDDGPGLDPELRDSIFDMGVSTTDEGTGFGLSIAAEIAQAHGWDLVEAGRPGGGARFELRPDGAADERFVGDR